MRRSTAIRLFGLSKNTFNDKDGWQEVGTRKMYYDLNTILSIKPRKKRTEQVVKSKPRGTPDTPWVYLIRAVGTNRYKVGFTYSVKHRLGELATSCPFPLELVASRHGTRETEAMIHQILTQYHSHLEWFDCEDEDHIKAVFMGASVVS